MAADLIGILASHPDPRFLQNRTRILEKQPDPILCSPHWSPFLFSIAEPRNHFSRKTLQKGFRFISHINLKKSSLYAIYTCIYINICWGMYIEEAIGIYVALYFHFLVSCKTCPCQFCTLLSKIYARGMPTESKQMLKKGQGRNMVSPSIIVAPSWYWSLCNIIRNIF